MRLCTCTCTWSSEWLCNLTQHTCTIQFTLLVVPSLHHNTATQGCILLLLMYFWYEVTRVHCFTGTCLLLCTCSYPELKDDVQRIQDVLVEAQCQVCMCRWTALIQCAIKTLLCHFQSVCWAVRVFIWHSVHEYCFIVGAICSGVPLPRSTT